MVFCSRMLGGGLQRTKGPGGTKGPLNARLSAHRLSANWIHWLQLPLSAFLSSCRLPVLRARLPHSHSVSSGPTEISDGVEVSDELSLCSDSSYDTYANSTATPVGPRGGGSRAKTLTDRGGH